MKYEFYEGPSGIIPFRQVGAVKYHDTDRGLPVIVFTHTASMTLNDNEKKDFIDGFRNWLNSQKPIDIYHMQDYINEQKEMTEGYRKNHKPATYNRGHVEGMLFAFHLMEEKLKGGTQ